MSCRIAPACSCIRSSLSVLALLAGLMVAPVATASEGGGEAVYVKLHPDFIVNLSGAGSGHLLLATIQVMSHDGAVIEQVRHHAPAIRHQLLLLLSDQSRDQVESVDGRKKLRADALAAVNVVMERETGSGDVEGLYFTNFVVE